MPHSFAAGVRSFPFVAALVLLSTSAFAQSSAEALNPQELVVGDWYSVTIAPQPALLQSPKQEVGGCLVKATDDWLAISTIRIVGRVRGVPWVSELPYVGAMFRTQSQVKVKVTLWIPRAVARITNRKKFAADPDHDVLSDEPKLAGECTILYRNGQHDAMLSGEVLAIADGQLRVSTLHTEQPPAGTRGEAITKKIEHQIKLDSVLYVSQEATIHAKKNQRK